MNHDSHCRIGEDAYACVRMDAATMWVCGIVYMGKRGNGWKSTVYIVRSDGGAEPTSLQRSFAIFWRN